MNNAHLPPLRKIIILYDGVTTDENTSEMGDSVLQAEESAEIYQGLGYETQITVFDDEGKKILLRDKGRNDVVILNLVEQIDGRDDAVWVCQQWLEENNFAFTGCPSAAAQKSDNKITSKALMREHGIPTAQWYEEGDILSAPTGKKWILKSACLHASLGIDEENVSTDLQALSVLAEKRRKTFGGEWFIEEYIHGREFNMGLMGKRGMEPELLPAAEMMFDEAVFANRTQKIVGYKAKWAEDSAEYGGTRARYQFDPSDNVLIGKIRETCRKCWRVFELGGYARVDFRIDEQGNPYVLEVNTNPCLSIGAGFLNASAQRGMSPADVMDKIAAYAR